MLAGEGDVTLTARASRLTTVTVHQVPNGPGIQIDVIPRDNAAERALVVRVSGKVIWHARPQQPASRSDS